jgi:hypothetical protein
MKQWFETLEGALQHADPNVNVYTLDSPGRDAYEYTRE